MAALLVLACLVAVAAAGLDPSRVRFIDMKNGNFLFRGNLPQTDNGTFAFVLHAAARRYRTRELTVTRQLRPAQRHHGGGGASAGTALLAGRNEVMR